MGFGQNTSTAWCCGTAVAALNHRVASTDPGALLRAGEIHIHRWHEDRLDGRWRQESRRARRRVSLFSRGALPPSQATRRGRPQLFCGPVPLHSLTNPVPTSTTYLPSRRQEENSADEHVHVLDGTSLFRTEPDVFFHGNTAWVCSKILAGPRRLPICEVKPSSLMLLSSPLPVPRCVICLHVALEGVAGTRQRRTAAYTAVTSDAVRA